jgi:hypothetical protein
MATGIATIDFGTHPGSNEASVAITGESSITSTSKVEAWVMADDSTTDHTANDHKYFAAFAALTCGTPTNAVGFTIYARSLEKLVGTFKVRWVWAD